MKTSVQNGKSGTGATGFVRELGLLDSTMIVAGSMIGSGIFIVPAEISRQVGSAGWLLLVWGGSGLLSIGAAPSSGARPSAHRRGPLLRRAGGDDAAGRRAVRLPARGLLAALGVPLRLDAVPGDPDRHHRRRGRGLRPLPRRAGAVRLAGELDRVPHQAVSRLRREPFGAAARGRPADRVPHLAQ